MGQVVKIRKDGLRRDLLLVAYVQSAGGARLIGAEDDWPYARGVRPLPMLWIRDSDGGWHATRLDSVVSPWGSAQVGPGGIVEHLALRSWSRCVARALVPGLRG